MTSPFRDQLKLWGDQCAGLGGIVAVYISAQVAGSHQLARAEARRIVSSFASLRHHEKEKVIKRCAKIGMRPPAMFPYDDVTVRMVEVEPARGWEVQFVKQDDDLFKRLYRELPPPDLRGTEDVYAEKVDGLIILPERRKHDLIDLIPDDVDIFTGEKL